MGVCFILFFTIFNIGCILCNNKYFKKDEHNIHQRDKSVPQIRVDLPLSSRLSTGTLILKCIVEGNPPPTIKWFINSQNSIHYSGFTQITDNDAYIVTSEGHLQFSSDSPSMSANFYYSATNMFGTVFSRKAEVQKIFQPSDISISYETNDIKLHNKAVIECIIKPNIVTSDYSVKHWIIEGTVISPEFINMTKDRFSVINLTKVPQLHIRNVTKSDFDHMRVRCVLENKYFPELIAESKQWTKPKEYTVDYYPKNFKFDKCKGYEIFVPRGASIELPWCNHPITPTIFWFKSNSSSQLKGHPIPITNPFRKYEMVSHRYGNLLIKKVDLSDEGYYFVTKDNKPLVDYSPFHLRVTIKIGIEIDNPDRLVAFGQSTEIVCRISGYPITDVFWLHNGVSIRPQSTSNLSSPISIESVIFIREVTLDTAGVYQCIVESRNTADSRIFDIAQKAVSVIIKEMSPRLISQTPTVPKNNLYATSKLEHSMKIVTIQCSFKAIPDATIEWFLDDEPIPLDSVINLKISSQEPNSKIALLHIDLNQLNSIAYIWKYGGLYVAKATNNVGSAECKTLVFVEGVFMIRDQELITLKHGQNWTLKCNVISDSKPEITWFKIKDGKRIKFPETHRETENRDKREIYIKDVVKGIHDASYECTAMLGDRKVTKMFNVSVVMPPLEITSSFVPVVSLKNRGQEEHNCQPKSTLDLPWYAWWELQQFDSGRNESVSTPLSYQKSVAGLSVSWRPTSNSKQLSDQLPTGVPYFLSKFANSACRIQIVFDKQLHMSSLICVVQNHAGIIRRGFRINMAVIEFNVQPPADKSIKLGGSFTLDCSPKPNQLDTTIIWTRNGEEVPLYEPDLLLPVYRFSNGTLVVTNMTDDKHNSPFMCMIKSSLTDPISKVVNILLQVPARIMPMPDKIDIVTKSYHSLNCTIYGDNDKLEMDWQRKKNNVWISMRNAFKADVTEPKTTIWTLKFENTVSDDAGLYKCVAKNLYSDKKVEKEIQVDVVAVPGSVNIVSGSMRMESRSIYIDWLEPVNNGNKPILDYLVTWRSEYDSGNRTVSESPITIDHLRPDSLYNISVRARNQVGLGDEVVEDMRTRQAVPEAPVQALAAVAKSSTSLRLTWLPPVAMLQNGRITKYEVCIRRLTSTEFLSANLTLLQWRTDTDVKSLKKKSFVICELVLDTKLVLTELPKFTGYGFRVCAINEMGMGPCLYIRERTLEDLPEKAPINVTYTGTSTNSINLQWNPPPQDSINGVVQHYLVRFFRPEHYGMEIDRLLNVTETKLKLPDLLSYSNYSIQVAVVNKKGMGPFSAPVIFATNQGAPSSPKVVKVFTYNDKCVLVVWAHTGSTNGPSLRYCVVVNQPDRNICQAQETVRGYQKMKVCDLTRGYNYVFKVIAYNNNNNLNSTATIIDMVRITESPRNAIISIPHSITVTDRATVVMDCETIPDRSYPVWYHYNNSHSNRIPIIPGRGVYHQSGNGSLIITNSSDATNGTYECSLSDSESINYTVYVKTVTSGIPSRPDIYYHSASINGIYISWRCAGSPRPDDPIRSFNIAINRDHVLVAETVVPGAQRTYNIDNLTCGTSYTVQLHAVNNAGKSEPWTLEVSTLGQRPLWANGSTLVTGVYSHSLCFNLSEFLPGNGCPADRFTITMIPPTTARHSFTSEDLHQDDSPQCTNVSGLHPNTSYSYTVVAANNAGNVSNNGHAITKPAKATEPMIFKTHQESFLNLFYDPKVYIIIAVVIVGFLMMVALGLYCLRKNYTDQMQPPKKVNNNLQPFPMIQSQPLITATPSASHRNRRLPEVPCNTYDSGMATLPKINNDDDDDMKPYATYAPLHPETLPPNARAQTGQKILAHDQTAYNAGSQAHSYQYPDMAGSSQQPPSLVMDLHANAPVAIESYDNQGGKPPPPPMMIGRQVYSKGYSVGGDARCPLLPQRPSESICQEPYRPGGSTWSNTTGSSTKELTQLFHHNYGGDMSSGLREQDEDNCSTIRPMNHSTLTAMPNRMMTTDDPQDSYFESGSSCVDPGIREFTQEIFRGQAVEPRFTSHVGLPFTRQSSSASSTYDSVDGPVHRRPSIPFADPSIRFVRQETLAEEEESSNYQNKFVIV